jgi:lysophospholipase L1-like esterase
MNNLPVARAADRPLALLLAAMTCCAASKSFAADGHWVGTWGCGPQMVENSVSQNNLPPAPLAYSTLRQFVHTTVGGQHLRVRFSNAYGTNFVVIQSAHVALAADPGSSANGVINPATDTPLSFHGGPSISIPPGAVVWSDPCDFNLPALTNLAISTYYGYVSPNTVNVGTITGHPGSRTTSYLRAGNWVSAIGISNSVSGTFTTVHWYNITGVDVLADPSSLAVVALGDSITDGRGPADNTNNRWPDFFAARLGTNPPTAGVGVLNMGIGGGAVLSGGLGPTALNRFERDVLSQSGVRWLIVFEGVNDIGSGASSMTTASNLVAAYTQFANRAHARNILVYGATITPFGGNGYYTTLHEAERQFVNAWIRTNTVCDGVIDFDLYVRDPVTLTNFQAAFFAGPNANDWLHMNALGYQTMASNIDLSLFTH